MWRKSFFYYFKTKFLTKNLLFFSSHLQNEMIWISCEGENPADIENLGPINYIPQRGFPGYFYPFMNQRGYMPPVIAINFERPKSKSKNLRVFKFSITPKFHFQPASWSILSAKLGHATSITIVPIEEAPFTLNWWSITKRSRTASWVARCCDARAPDKKRGQKIELIKKRMKKIHFLIS